ncbi:hypothetical protein Y11_41421 [Yersinia enterocolitica subsp. palearctica Y11]|uniref:Uncharacterized protein n=1 Tax=Yersinia enterocolitica subsp. palearctica serotype O:3 (strain DSM 13030 / CIP 106945 / Y11) TaxID=930944 RepID=A0A0H3NXZ3_YERE1|nr:hypothetical protein Y11_41421 [Yersinia enterocolitica subsp. palearctica Y11]CCO66951.1 hypothetical protein D322_55 [Yersinia enterocolitica IP 10393]
MLKSGGYQLTPLSDFRFQPAYTLRAFLFIEALLVHYE